MAVSRMPSFDSLCWFSVQDRHYEEIKGHGGDGDDDGHEAAHGGLATPVLLPDDTTAEDMLKSPVVRLLLLPEVVSRTLGVPVVLRSLLASPAPRTHDLATTPVRTPRLRPALVSLCLVLHRRPSRLSAAKARKCGGARCPSNRGVTATCIRIALFFSDGSIPPLLL
jgi:hypothetical protein